MPLQQDTDTLQAATGLRRRSVLAGAAALATLGGVGLSQLIQDDDAAPATPLVSTLVEGFWAMEWDTPNGKRLPMHSLQGQPLLLNFWATWCPPCVEELPLINAFFHQNRSKGWQVLGLAIDNAESVRTFLRKTPLDFPVGLAGLKGAELVRALGNLPGGLPFSVVIGTAGGLLHRQLGRLSAENLAAWASLK